MPQNKPSGATLGYLAPICVAVFFVFVWIVFGTRQRFRPSHRTGDPDGWPLGLPHSSITPADLDARFPLIKYSAWLLTTHQAVRSKEAEVQVKPDTGQAPTSRSFESLDAEEKEVGGNAADADGQADSNMECAICMESFEDDDSIRALTCRHIFHATCLDPWFTKRQARCPLCKAYYPPDPSSPTAPRLPPAALIRNQIFPRVV